MSPKRQTKEQRLARQLDQAAFATLNSRAISEAARALVDDVYARVVAWEQKSSERKNKRHKGAAKFREAVEAFTADLVRARPDRTASGWVYRSLHAKSFTRERVSYRSFATLVEGLCALRLVTHKPGFQAKADFGAAPVVSYGKASRFTATETFLALMKRHAIDPAYAVDHFTEDLPKHPVVLHAASTRSRFTGAKISGRNLRINYTPKVRQIENEVKELNEYLRQQRIEGLMHQYFLRIYNEGDAKRFTWNLGGRLYSPGMTSYQQRDREQRLAMRINGEQVCEIDISASYLTIFLGQFGKEIGSRDFWSDPYLEPNLNQHDRDAVKQWFVMTFGSNDLIAKWSTLAIKEFRENNRKDLRKSSPIQIRDAALKAYPLLERWPDDIRTWADLMWIESQAVVAAMLLLMRDHDVPSLPVHDSLVVPASQQRLAEDCLSRSYRTAAGVWPLLRTHRGPGSNGAHEQVSTRKPPTSQWDF